MIRRSQALVFSAAAMVWVHAREARLERRDDWLAAESEVEEDASLEVVDGEDRRLHDDGGRTTIDMLAGEEEREDAPEPPPSTPLPSPPPSPSRPPPAGWSSPPSLPVPPAPPPLCGSRLEETELGGHLASGTWGADLILPDAGACCNACVAHVESGYAAEGKECNAWVFCARPGGCGDRQHGECWLKHSGARSAVKQSGRGTPWTSGMIVRSDKLAAAARARARGVKDKQLRWARARAATWGNRRPRVYWDVDIGGKLAGRVVFSLFYKEAPLAAENFRALCTGERGVVPPGRQGVGHPYAFKGNRFHRVVHDFAIQTGTPTESVYGGHFPDDPGGLALRHDKPGLVSMANDGPGTNAGQVSIFLTPAPHMDGKAVVFAEVVSGFDVLLEVNALADPEKLQSRAAGAEGRAGTLKETTIRDAGVIDQL